MAANLRISDITHNLAWSLRSLVTLYPYGNLHNRIFKKYPSTNPLTLYRYCVDDVGFLPVNTFPTGQTAMARLSMSQ